jgi:D-alanyl-D-alanine dipeptidase
MQASIPEQEIVPRCVLSVWFFVINFISNKAAMFNKVINRFYIQLTTVLIFSTTSGTSYSQQPASINVVNKYKIYKQQLRMDPLKKMVELRTTMPAIQYELRYASLNNFMHQQLYKKGDATYLRLPVVNALAKVQQELNEKGLTLKIWDAYRPYRVTVKMWELIKDDRYVADPKKGSAHNRGTAVDLTIVDLKNGKELNMGTSFDNFSDTAHQGFTQLPEEILQNRLLLKTTMEKYGFIALSTEWWHYYWNKANDYEVLDIDFKKLKK